MSKIYEALRQAELDRGSRSGRPAPESEPGSPDAPPASSDIAVLDSFADPAPAIIPPPPTPTIPSSTFTPPIPSAASAHVFAPAATSPLVSEPIPVPAERIDQLAAAPVDVHALDLTGVKALRWNPSLDQLPALLESGAAVEQFRSLRSRMFEFRDLSSLKSVLVSSGMPQEGKTFIAANLAVAFARHKAARVLLIDGDMRRSRLHTIFGTTQGPGLTEYLSGKSSLSEVMQRADSDSDNPLPPGIGSLTFIPGGLDHSKAADLAGNHRFDRLIESVAPFFDWIVVDSSPVNLVSDGTNLARACDGVLLVARGSVTKYEAAQRALGELKAAKVLGFVLNAVHDPSEAGAYYSYGSYEPYFNPADVPQESMVASAT